MSNQAAAPADQSSFVVTPIGWVSSPRVELINVDGTSLTVRGQDAVDGTPVLDIKPYMSEFAPRKAVSQPGWSHELMASYF